MINDEKQYDNNKMLIKMFFVGLLDMFYRAKIALNEFNYARC